jgi:alkanesulfonate monooxygenase SsuD/methylene tetrahydromethanopterin reductase-like flavin-dependent oxidoreductase (luciferase family)
MWSARAAAAVTATMRLHVGSGICLVIQRDPIITAKEVASVDYLSGGQFEFGVGAGWNRPEMENHGTDPRTRMALLRERVEAMKATRYPGAGPGTRSRASVSITGTTASNSASR